MTEFMTDVFTVETFEFLYKSRVVKLILKNQENTTNTITSFAKEMKKLNSRFKRLEPGVAVTKKKKNALVKQVASFER